MLWLGFIVLASARAESLCESDANHRLASLRERFISANCASCWQAAAAQSTVPSAAPIDWIVPSQRAEEAPLSAVELIESEERLRQLGLGPFNERAQVDTRIANPAGLELDLSVGVAIGGYRGLFAELRMKPDVAVSPELELWLVMLEHIPAGVEGSRQDHWLARNALQHTWRRQDIVPRDGHLSATELRPMRMPEGMQPERMLALAWVQTPGGQILQAALADCRRASPAQAAREPR